MLHSLLIRCGVLALLLGSFAGQATEEVVFGCGFAAGPEPQTAIQPCRTFNRGAAVVDLSDGGKALRFGQDATGAITKVSYRLEGKVDPASAASGRTPFPLRAGRMEFRFRPVDWEIGDPSFNMLVSMAGPNRNAFHLVYIRASSTGLPSVQAAYGRHGNPEVAKGKQPVLFPYAALDPDREWHQVCFEWSPLQLKLTVDGNEQILSTRDMTIPDRDFFATELTIGAEAATLLRGMTDIADLKISAIIPEDPSGAVSHRPRLSIPRIAAPVPDGRIDEAEYRDALQVTGFIQLPAGRIGARQSVARLGHDDENLYLALTSPGHHREPKHTYTDNDSNLWEDDSVELLLDPTPETPDYYQWIFNYNGAVFEQHVEPGKSVSECRGFSTPGVRAAAKFDAETRSLEIALPLACIGGLPAPEAEWGFNLCETNPGDGLYSLAQVKNSYAEHDAFGRIRFSRAGEPAFRLERLGDLYRGAPDIVARTPKLEVTGRRYDATAMTEFPVFSEVIEARPDGLVRFAADSDLLGKTGTLYLTAFDGGQTTFAAAYPYEAVSCAEIENLRRIAGSDGDRLRVSSSQSAEPGNQLRFSLRDASGNEYKAFPAVPVSGLRQESFLPLAGIAPGTYLLAMELTGPDGTVIQTAEPRELTVFSAPPWQGRKIGVTDTVPPPWTPLEVTEQSDAVTVKCWNREYRFNASSLFPVSLQSGGVDYLNGAPELVLAVDGKSEPVPGNGITVLSRSDRRVVIATRGAIARTAEFTVTATIDYDGFLWFDCDVAPERKLASDKLQLRFTMPEAQSTLLNSGYRDLTDTGRLPQSPWSKKLDDLFGPFWVGNEKGGLSFGIESAEHWSNRDSGRQAVVEREAGGTSIALNFIDMPSTLEQSIRYGFYLQPTPVRPQPRPFRTLRSNMYFAHLHEQMDGKPYPENLSWWTGTHRYQGYPYWLTTKEGIAYWEKSMQVTPRPWNNFDGLPSPSYRTAWYATYSSIGRNAPETIWYGEAWRAGERDKLYGDTLYGYDQDMIEVCKTDDYIDFYLWRFDRSRKEDPKIDGIYFDLMQFPACTRTDHQHGYAAGGGTRRPTWNIREHRKFLERIYCYCKLEADNAPVIMHMSGATARIGGFSFADYYLDGELWSDVLVRDRSYRAMRLDQFRAEALPHIYGPGFIWICQLHRILPFVPANQRKGWQLEPWAERHMAGILLLHDIIPDRTSQFDTAYRIWLALDRFGLAEEDRYLPYYEQPDRFAANADGIHTAVTGFAGRGKLLLVCFNNRDAAFTFKVNTGLRDYAGGPSTSPVVRDLESQTELPATGPTVDVVVPERNFRLIEIDFSQKGA